MGLQDALRILLHQRAPAHLPCQKQILTIHGVQVLNLQPGGQKTKERDRAGQTSGGIRKQPSKGEEEEGA